MNPVPLFASTPAALYLDLIEKCLTNTIYGDGYTDGWKDPTTPRFGRPAATGRGKPTR